MIFLKKLSYNFTNFFFDFPHPTLKFKAYKIIHKKSRFKRLAIHLHAKGTIEEPRDSPQAQIT